MFRDEILVSDCVDSRESVPCNVDKIELEKRSIRPLARLGLPRGNV